MRKIQAWAMLVIGLLAIAGAAILILRGREEPGLMAPSSYTGAAHCDRVVLDRRDIPIPVYAHNLRGDDVRAAVWFWNRGFPVQFFEFREGIALYDDSTEAIAVAALSGNPRDMLPDPEHARSHLRLIGCFLKRMDSTIPNDMQAASSRQRAIAHELGHLLGLDHDDAETSVMYRRATAIFGFEISEQDRALLEEIYAGPVQEL